jgi:hypothetical protein
VVGEAPFAKLWACAIQSYICFVLRPFCRVEERFVLVRVAIRGELQRVRLHRSVSYLVCFYIAKNDEIGIVSVRTHGRGFDLPATARFLVV